MSQPASNTRSDQILQDIRIRAFKVILPLLTAGYFMVTYVVYAQPHFAWEIWLFASAAIFTGLTTLACWIEPNLYKRVTLPTVAVVISLMLLRTYTMNSGAIMQDPTQSMFRSAYAFIPIIYLLNHVVLPSTISFKINVLLWIVLMVIIALTVGPESQINPNREGLRQVVLFTFFTGPICLALLRAFPDFEMLLTEAVQELAESKIIREDLVTQASTDHLTGLYNRRFFELKLETERQLTTINQQPMCLAILDIDHFKLYNDTYGHNAGDDILQQVASILDNSVRGKDVICRYGGEEFALLFPATQGPDAFQVCERIHNKLSTDPIVHSGTYEGRLTISIGIAEMSHLAIVSVSELLALADKQLYEAKNLGRNRTRVTSIIPQIKT